MTTSENNNLTFPDFNLALSPEEPCSLADAEDTYRNMLLETGTDYNVLYANKLLEIKKLLKPSNLSPVKKDLEDLIKHLNAWKKKMGYTFPIFFQRRKKSDIKCHDKIRLFLTKQYINDEDITLDTILDTLGIRIIPCLGNIDTVESIKICFDILEETINFFTLKKGYNPHQKGKMFGLGIDPKKHPNVIVSKTFSEMIKPAYTLYVKNYYAEPKKDDGYQSLHIVFDRITGPIEIQIRTYATHKHIEDFHKKYSNQRYSEKFDKICLDREKINILGYSYSNGSICDLVGLETAIDPYNQIY